MIDQLSFYSEVKIGWIIILLFTGDTCVKEPITKYTPLPYVDDHKIYGFPLRKWDFCVHLTHIQSSIAPGGNR